VITSELTSRRRWVALTLATALLQFAYWPIVASLVRGDPQQADLLWLGLAITPFVFIVLAFGSGHPRAAGAAGKAMGLFLLVALPLAMLNTIVGLVAGFGAAAVIALRGEEGVHSRRARAIAVAAASLYVLALLLLQGMLPALGPFAIISGAILPMAVVGLTDELADDRAARAAEQINTRP